jgi:predicted Zn-dependent protease
VSGGHERDLERAERLYAIGQIDGAIDTLRRVLSDDPDQPEAHAWLAACLLRKRRLHAATVEAQMALTLAPESTLARWVGAEVELARRDFGAAERHIEALLADAPGVPAFHRLKAGLALSGRRAAR